MRRFLFFLAEPSYPYFNGVTIKVDSDESPTCPHTVISRSTSKNHSNLLGHPLFTKLFHETYLNTDINILLSNI